MQQKFSSLKSHPLCKNRFTKRKEENGNTTNTPQNQPPYYLSRFSGGINWHRTRG